MKTLYILLLFLWAIHIYAQDAFSVIDVPNTVDTGLHITGVTNVGLFIDNTSLFSFGGIDNISTGIKVRTGQTGIISTTTNLHSNGLVGVSNRGFGVRGISNSASGAGIYGQNEGGDGIVGVTFGDDATFAGVKGKGGSSIGVLGEASNGIGISGFSFSGIGVKARSSHANGAGMEASSMSGVAGKFSSELGSQPDIEFPLSLRAVGGSLTFNSEGIISSDVTVENSSLRLWTNQNLTIELDRDGSATDNGFIIRDSDDDRLLSVRESSGVELKGPLELFAQSGDNGIIRSDRTQASSDLILDSNHDIVLRLDENGGESGQLRVEDSGNTVIFRLFETGNLNITGTLNQGSDINRKHSILPTNNSSILHKIDKLPVYNWKYNHEDIPHLGPMAQDFYEAFQLGSGETTISSVDADGVALAGIKALINENQKLEEEITEMKSVIQELKEWKLSVEHILKSKSYN